MTVIDKINEINDSIKDIFEFIQSNEIVKDDFTEYLSTIGANGVSLNQMEKIFLPYVFERKINNASILEMFSEVSKNREIVECLINAQHSIYEIKKILKNGFELYNLVNEKTYVVLSLTKMTSFRGIYAGQYIVARIFDSNNQYYMIEISSILSHSQREDAYKYAVMKLVQDPKQLYIDNLEKEAEIKSTIEAMYQKFIQTFDKNVIFTTNIHADEIIGAFNDGEVIDISEMASNLEDPKFFHVKELDNNYSNFLENSLGGFSSHSETYDVAVIFDKEKGLYAIPFYETFINIFEGKNVEGKNECIKYFLTNDSIPNTIIESVYQKYPNFLQIINESLNKEYSFDEIIREYKSEYLKYKLYSSATVLYCSKAFSNVFDTISTMQENPVSTDVTNEKVGRNEPCPCGSGKKYKHCCGS